ncbi:hypothetical protein AB0B31_15085 [Catellatospora citrea]|uniref:hypothetical protein n=1 Tax=Catellatospora citrea TaxID=53366 RepID=UPI0033FBA768
MELVATCGACGAVYPGNFVIEPGAAPPFAWAREPKNTVCSCEPPWPRLMVMIDGGWYVGSPGSGGEWVIDGAAQEAFCRSCGAYHLGDMSIDVHDRSHLVGEHDE